MQSSGHRVSADEMDETRQKNIVYEYLCHLEEAKTWMEACIEEDLPDVEKFEEEMRHGVYLAKLANFFSSNSVTNKKIFDVDLLRYRSTGLHYRHTDNINYFLRALKDIKLPKIFHPETTDIYDRKNLPKAVFCVHALSLYLFRLGIAPQIQNLYGKIQFSEEVVSAMMSELTKFGCHLPQFGKIGGILANELPVDDAVLLAAVIAINEAVTKQDLRDLESTLVNVNSHLSNVLRENVSNYMEALHEAQEEKRAIALNKSREDNFIPDVYDELLTQAEIQGFLNQTNIFVAVDNVQEAVLRSEEDRLWACLKNSSLNLKNVKRDSCGAYLSALHDEMVNRKDQSFNGSLIGCYLSKSVIQKVITTTNGNVKALNSEKDQLTRLNRSLVNGSPESTFLVLSEMRNKVESLLEYAAPLYHEEMAAIRADAQTDLTMAEVLGGVRFLSALARVSAAVETGSIEEVLKYLGHPEAHVQNLERNYIRDYAVRLSSLREAKRQSKAPCPLLTFIEIQDCVDFVNEKKTHDNSKIAAVKTVNDVIKMAESDEAFEALLNALSHPALEVNITSRRNIPHFRRLLLELASEKGRSSRRHENGGELWLEDILGVADDVTRHEAEATTSATFLASLNTAVKSADVSRLKQVLMQFNSSCYHIRQELMDSVMQRIVSEAAYRDPKKWTYRVPHCLQSGHQISVNIVDGSFSWGDVGRGETNYGNETGPFSVRDLIKLIQEAENEKMYTLKIEKRWTRLQARCRGYLVRHKLNAKRRSATIIQSWWRMVVIRRSYEMYRLALRMWEPQIIKIQRAFRSWRKRRRTRRLLEDLRDNVDKVLVIQRAWRKYKARVDLQALTHCQNPPFTVVSKFVHLLQVTSSDFEEEIMLQSLKSDVVKRIRTANRLESRIDEMDVKIGLLVQNRITLEDVFKITADKENVNPLPSSSVDRAPTKKQKKSHKEAEKYATIRSQRGLKALTKESRDRLSGYQHLFYLLQTEPRYLATLIFSLPLSKTTRFVENIIFTLYNYGANARDNFLLLKLFKAALEEEIRSKVLRLNDIVSGNPLVIKMIVSFHRKGAGQASLRDILGPLVNKVISDSSLHISTNPVEIYKTWVNQLEMSSGQPSGMPYVVSQEQALQHPEVKSRLMKAINSLREQTRAFCDRITSCRHMIPYGLQYLSKVMKSALHKRFPHVPEKEILKVVGNVIYYRFINCAIVAPDAFDIVSLPPDKKLTNDQRRNLASIAKVLQFAATKKGYGEEASHLMGLNSFIVECHEQFREFFRECSLVEDPESVYGVHQYSEQTLIIKPTVYITLQEIVQTHELLLENEEIIAPDEADSLHGLLRDLGDKQPSVYTLIGDSEAMDEDSRNCPVGRTEVCLALGRKVDLQTELEDQKGAPKDSNDKLFTKTTKLLVDLIQCTSTDKLHDIPGLVAGPTLPQQEALYRDIVRSRAKYEQEAKLNQTGLNRTNSFLNGVRVSLSEVKTKLSHNLRRLENRGLSSRSDQYQSLLNAVALDIVNQSKRRRSRRTELQKLTVALKKLQEKEQFYNEQLDSYNTYLNTCLSNLASRNKNVHAQAQSTRPGKGQKRKLSVKYTGARLHERGVILEVEDLPPSQLKNVLFEICPLPTSGRFEVQVKFMGVAMEVVHVDIQDLLQLQYEGVNVKTMFGKAKVNVNLLLFLLNSKFYCKKK